MASDTKAEKTTEELQMFNENISKIQEDFFRKQLEEKVYTLRDQVKTLEEKLERYREVLSQKDEQIEQLTAGKQRLIQKFTLVQEDISNDVCLMEGSRTLNKHQQTMLLLGTRQELENEKASCKKQREKYKDEFFAYKTAAFRKELQLQEYYQRELETVKCELKQVRRDCDETVNNLEKKLEDVENKYQMQILEVTKQNQDPKNARLRAKDDMIVSLKNKLQKKEDIIKKQAARYSELREVNETLKEDADRERENRVLLDVRLKSEKAKNDTLSGECQKHFNQWFLLNDKHTSLNKTMKEQTWKNKMLEERLRQTKLEADRYKQELFICTEAFEEAFPHGSQRRDPAFRQFQTKFLVMKKKYLQDATLSQTEKETFKIVTEYLEEKLKLSEQRTGELLKEVEKWKRDKHADRIKYERSLTAAQTRISEWGNSLLKEECEQKKEIGLLKRQVKELQLKREKKGRGHGETPRTSTAQPKTGPGTVKRYQLSRSL